MAASSVFGGGGQIEVWDVPKRELLTTLHTTHVLTHLALSAAGDMLAAGAAPSGEVLVWPMLAVLRRDRKMTAPPPPETMPGIPAGGVSSLAFGQCGLVLAASGRLDLAVRVWRVQPSPEQPTGTLVQRLAHRRSVDSVAFGGDGARMGDDLSDILRWGRPHARGELRKPP